MSYRTRLVRTALGNVTKLALQRISMATDSVLSKPTSVFILVTHSCNLRCKQCNVPRLTDLSSELSTEQWKKILRQLHEWLGPVILRWGGGEPFMRKDMLELLKYSAELGMLSNVVTNGHLINKILAERIVEADTFCLSVSIDGMQKGHDFVRGDGAFAKAVAAIRFLNEARSRNKSDMRIMINTTLMETNLDEINDLVNWAETEGLNGVSISALQETLATAKPDPRWFEKSPLWVRNLKKLDRVIDDLIKKSGPKSAVINPPTYLRGIKKYYHDPTAPKPTDFTCHVGLDHFRIGPHGYVCLCPYIPSSLVGNLIESTPEQIWKSQKATVSRKKIKACHKNCSISCLYKRSLSEKFEFFLKLFT